MLLAIDIGGTKLAAARIDNGVITARRQVAMPASADAFALAIDTLVRDWPAPRALAVASTGYIDGGTVRAVNRDIISFWNGFALADLLRARFDCPLLLLNDAQAAAWGEYQARRLASPASHPGSLLFMTLSTGVGGGLVLDHRLRHGPHGLAGHIGHAAARLGASDGVSACGCGRTGCLEMIASGTALARQATARFGRPLDSAQLFALAATDARAAAIVDNAAAAVAEAIAGLHLTLDLCEVVIGGSVGLAAGMLSSIARALQRLDLPRAPLLSAAMLGADAGLIGAAACLD